MKNAGHMLQLRGRYYRTIPITRMGYDAMDLSLEAGRTALVVLHCWDIGCEGGPEIDPNFFVGMGTHESFREAARIMRECIRPAMDAARRAGVLVCHVEHPDIARRYPQSREEADPPEPPGPASEPVVPGWNEEALARAHGRDYARRSPYARMGRAQVVAPLPGEPVAYQTGQFDRVLRRRGIENLLYSGFASDMCVLRAPGGLEPMMPCGYRRFLLSDATLGVEFADTFEERIATRWAMRYFESHGGITVLTSDFIAACRAIRA